MMIRILLCTLAVVLSLAPGSPVRAATLIVDTVVDNASLTTCDAAVPNDCSLRGAIIKAAGLSGANTVQVPAGTYILTQSTSCTYRINTDPTSVIHISTPALCLSGNLTLVGDGAATTIIDANQPAGNNGTITPVAFVSSLANVEIRGLTLKRGNFSFGGSTWGTGGAIRTSGSLLLVDSVVSESFSIGNGAGIYNSGTLSLLRSSVAHNSTIRDGGGIFNFGAGIVTMADSALTENTGANGGGMSNFSGTVNITGSTINGNIGTGFGGGINNGTFNTMFLTNTTVSGNHGRTSGGINNSSTLHLKNVTITNNLAQWFDVPNSPNGIAGGLGNNSPGLTLANTIIAGNIAASGASPDCSAFGPHGNALVSSGYNLIQSVDGCDITGDTTGNVIGKDAKLGLLTQNGGPTATHAPADGSPAIDAGSPLAPGGSGAAACVAIDQRKFIRPLGARCDIGAFERGGAFAVAAVLPATGGNTGTVSVLVSGSGFASGAGVVLRRSGQPDLAGAPVVVDAGGSAIAGTFDLTGRPAGAWDVVVVNADLTSRTLVAGFTIELGRPADLWVDVVGSVRRPGHPSQLTIIYGNRANVDAVGVPLWLSVPKGYAVSTFFQLAPPPERVGQSRPDWSLVAPVLLTSAPSAFVQVPLLLPVVPAGFTGILRIGLTVPLNAQDSLIFAVIGDPLVAGGLDPKFVSDTIAGATAYLERNFSLAVPPSVLPDLEQFLTGQLAAIILSGRQTFTGTLGTETQVYSLAHLNLDLALFAVLRVASTPDGTRFVNTWLSRAYRWLLASSRGAMTTVLGWLGPTEAWAGGAAVRVQNCGAIMGEGQSGCGGKQDTLRDILPPEIPTPPGCDPTKPKEFTANKCLPTKDICDALPGYKVVIAQGGAPFCVPDNPSKNCSRLVDNPILGASGNIGCKVFPLRPSTSVDPNDKVGAFGAGAAQFILAGTPLSYALHFENLSTATAAAQLVVVTDQLNPDNVDLDTFRLGPISFGNLTLVPAPGVQAYTGGVDFRPDQNIVVTVTAGLDTSTGLVTWRFTSIDPDTGQLTEDPVDGFLPPNTVPPQGEGTVVFTVMPKATIVTGTTITNQARVFFDLNAPIDTPVWLNTIDATKPTSQVNSAGPPGPDGLLVQWSGSDVGAGIQDYSIFVSENGGASTAWLADTSETSGTFVGACGKSYAFYSVARDLAGNVEAAHETPDRTVTLGVCDLAIVHINAPPNVDITKAGSVTKTVTVKVQNRSPLPEIVPDAVALAKLVTLTMQSLGACPAPTVALRPRKYPVTLKSKQMLNVAFNVTFDCPNDPADTTSKNPGHDDFRVSARLDHFALGTADAHPDDDVCPRSVTPPGVIVPYPDGTILDKGCGTRKPDGTFGAPIVIDVIKRP